MDIDENELQRELEREQLDYIKKMNGDISVPDYTDNFPSKFSPKDKAVVLDREQEAKIIDEIRSKIPFKMQEQIKPRARFTLSSFIEVLSSSFVGIMDDLLNFDGNLEDINEILTKDDRLVFIGTIILIISVVLLTR